MQDHARQTLGQIGAGGVLTIDIDAIARNYDRLSARVAPARAGAVVKADSYGLGAAQVAPALYARGCRAFFVATPGEALELRPKLASDAAIYVLNGVLPGAERACAEAGITPVLNSPAQIAAWRNCAAALGRPLHGALQFDTGMSRLGLSEPQIEALCADPEALQGLTLDLVMSHLASADEPDCAQNQSQLAAMTRFAAHFPDLPVCLANSGGIFLGGAFLGQIARPGIALYGGMGDATTPIEPVLRLDLRVVQIREVPAGAAVGYNRTHVTTAPTRLAVLGAGYADGLPRSLSNRGAAYVDGQRLAITGRVSMDSLIVDITALPEGRLSPGDLVELIGPHQSPAQLAADAGTISYEILTSLGHRYQRRYSDLAQAQHIGDAA